MAASLSITRIKAFANFAKCVKLNASIGKNMKKKKNKNLTDIIATIALLSGLCGMVYSYASDFENEQSKTRAMAASCLTSLVGGMVFTMRSDKQR